MEENVHLLNNIITQSNY